MGVQKLLKSVRVNSMLGYGTIIDKKTADGVLAETSSEGVPLAFCLKCAKSSAEEQKLMGDLKYSYHCLGLWLRAVKITYGILVVLLVALAASHFGWF